MVLFSGPSYHSSMLPSPSCSPMQNVIELFTIHKTIDGEKMKSLKAESEAMEGAARGWTTRRQCKGILWKDWPMLLSRKRRLQEKTRGEF